MKVKPGDIIRLTTQASWPRIRSFRGHNLLVLSVSQDGNPHVIPVTRAGKPDKRFCSRTLVPSEFQPA